MEPTGLVVEATLSSSVGMQLAASSWRPLGDALQAGLHAVWGNVRKGARLDGGLLPPALRDELARVHAFHFRGALWLLEGDFLEQVDASDGIERVRYPTTAVLEGELGQRLGHARLEPAFILDERRTLWFLKGTVDGELSAFPVVFDASPNASERWQVLYPDLEVSPNDWRIAASEPRTLFATDDEDVFELRGRVPSERAPDGTLSVPTAWTLELGQGRYHFGEHRAVRARPPLLSTAPLEGRMGRDRVLAFTLSRDEGAPIIRAARAKGEEPLVWFRPGDRALEHLDDVLCRGSVHGDEALTLDITSPDALTVRYWRTPR